MSKPPKIEIANWGRLQHFKDRDPIWIKLYRALRQNRRWRLLTGDAAKFYIDLLLLAADDEPFGSIQLHLDELCWEVRLSPDTIIPLLEELVVAGLITSPGYQPDIKQITAGNQEDTPMISLARSREVEEEVEKEKETTNDQRTEKKRWSPDVVHIDLGELALFCKDFGIPHEEMNMSLKRLDATKLLPLR